MSQKSRLSSFLIFFNTIYVNKAQRVPPFTFFGTTRHFLKEKNSKISSFFSKSLLYFLSLRYSADFRRSRLVYYFCDSRIIIETSRRQHFFSKILVILKNSYFVRQSISVRIKFFVRWKKRVVIMLSYAELLR